MCSVKTTSRSTRQELTGRRTCSQNAFRLKTLTVGDSHRAVAKPWPRTAFTTFFNSLLDAKPNEAQDHLGRATLVVSIPTDPRPQRVVALDAEHVLRLR